MMRGCRSSSFIFVRSFVTPAKALKSPADSVVCRRIHRGRTNDTVGSFHRAQLIDCLGRADIIGKAHLNGLAPVRD